MVLAFVAGCSIGGSGLEQGLSAGSDGAIPFPDSFLPPDVLLPDASISDGAMPDGGSGSDGGMPDGGVPDGSVPDGAVPDASTPDSGAIDATRPDSSGSDAEGQLRKTTFYACSTGTPEGAAVAAVIVVLGIAIVRRRRTSRAP